jgi:hypothetical protein
MDSEKIKQEKSLTNINIEKIPEININLNKEQTGNNPTQPTIPIEIQVAIWAAIITFMGSSILKFWDFFVILPRQRETELVSKILEKDNDLSFLNRIAFLREAGLLQETKLFWQNGQEQSKYTDKKCYPACCKIDESSTA